MNISFAKLAHRASTLTIAATCMVGSASTLQAQTFIHPGVLLSHSQLDTIKARIAAQIQPQYGAYLKTVADPLASASYTPHPWATVQCGSYNNPNYGCTDELQDAQAAYTQALLWYITGTTGYANKAIQIMNAWSGTLTGGHTDSNAPLQAAWGAQLWGRAAEIIRYTAYTQNPDGSTTPLWSATNAAAFGQMLKTQYLPYLTNPLTDCRNTNWQTSSIEARANIAVYLEDGTLFNTAMTQWRTLLPASIYLVGDSSQPLNRPNNACKFDWTFGKTLTQWDSGLTQEMCRDLAHDAYGLSGFINAAETARIQGVDLYGDIGSSAQARLTAAMEYILKYDPNGSYQPVPSGLCGGTLSGSAKGTFEIGYNQYHNRSGILLPNTLNYLNKNRPLKGSMHFLWETLSHGDLDR